MCVYTYMLRVAGRTASAGAALATTLAGVNAIGEVSYREDPQGLGEAARLLRLSSTAPPRLSASQQADLAANGYVVVARFLTAAHLRAARAEVAAMRKAGAFAPAVGGEVVRTDSVHWLGIRAAQPALVAALAELRALPATMRSFGGFEAARVEGAEAARPLLGVPREGQLACYEPAASREGQCSGARYRPHRDGFASPHPRALLLPGIYMREVTAVLYLSPNEDEWAGASGGGEVVATGGAAAGRPGSLVLYLDAAAEDERGATASRVAEVRPVAGTLVLFDSRRMLHEVLPHGECSAERVALTVWFGGAHRGASLRDVLRAMLPARCLGVL